MQLKELQTEETIDILNPIKLIPLTLLIGLRHLLKDDMVLVDTQEIIDRTEMITMLQDDHMKITTGVDHRILTIDMMIRHTGIGTNNHLRMSGGILRLISTIGHLSGISIRIHILTTVDIPNDHMGLLQNHHTTTSHAHIADLVRDSHTSASNNIKISRLILILQQNLSILLLLNTKKIRMIIRST